MIDLSRFKYPTDEVPAMRVLDARFVDDDSKAVEHLVQLRHEDGHGFVVGWMPIERWRELARCN